MTTAEASAPSLAEPSPPQALAAIASPSFDVVRVGPKGNTVVAGRAQPSASVQIFDGNTRIGQFKADSHGEWVFIPPSCWR